MDVVTVKHGARVRRPPQRWLSFCEPWKYAAPISCEQTLWGQVTADCKEPIGFVQGVFPPVGMVYLVWERADRVGNARVFGSVFTEW